MDRHGITAGELAACARIPIRFAVTSRLRVEPLDRGLGGLALREEAVASPYIKDYDALPDHGPTGWAKRFALLNWRMFLLRDEAGAPVAAATVATRTPGLRMLEDDPSRAVLWDLRVHPDHRGRGLGRAVFTQATAWAESEGFATMHIETQNINVAACRFYSACGATLAQIRCGAYPDFPDETMLIWCLPLGHRLAGQAPDMP